MHVARHTALWLAAAIVSIVVALAPSAARAHAGHPHPATPHTTGPHVGAHAAEASSAEAIRAVHAGAASSCSCRVCAHGGCACCAVGLAPAADATLPAPRHDGRATARDGPIPAGIAPETLPEPPRSFA